MPGGLNLQTCSCCGKPEIVGDCITCVCMECSANGHTGPGCKKCERELYARLEQTKTESLAKLRAKGAATVAMILAIQKERERQATEVREFQDGIL